MDDPERRLDGQLWVSDLGKNPYGAARRLVDGVLEPFDFTTQLKLKGGQALEDYHIPRIIEQIDGRARRQVPLFDARWSGYADLVLDLPGYRGPIIYDHKGTAGRWWDYKETLPRAADCCQVWLYGQLYQEALGEAVAETRLLYTGWGTWAEFRVELGLIPAATASRLSGHLTEDPEPGILCYGWITNDKGTKVEEVYRYRRVNPIALRLELERLWDSVQSGLFPPAEVEAMNPDGPDWDYAADAYDRLRLEFPQAWEADHG